MVAAVTIADAPPVSIPWLLDVAQLLGVLSTEDCWYEGPLFQCEPCQARDLISRAPTMVYHAAVSVDVQFGRRIETVETSLV